MGPILCLVLGVNGCSGRQVGIRIPEFGFSMKVPPGWKLGRSATMQEFALHKKFYHVEPDGKFCFESETERYPHASVHHASLSKYKSLGAYADTAKLICGRKILSTKHRTICGFEAIEIVGEGFSVLSKTHFKAILVFIRKGDEVVWITLGAPKEKFNKYEPRFHECIKSINIRT